MPGVPVLKVRLASGASIRPRASPYRNGARTLLGTMAFIEAVEGSNRSPFG